MNKWHRKWDGQLGLCMGAFREKYPYLKVKALFPGTRRPFRDIQACAQFRVWGSGDIVRRLS